MMLRKLFLMVFLGSYTIAVSNPLHEDSNYGVAEMQGRRSSMEDEVDYAMNDDHAFFAVYDGHGGRYVSMFARDNLRANCNLYEANSEDDIHNALRAGFIKTHNDLDDAWSYQTGSTATVAFFKNGTLYIANTGDSRTVLCTAGQAELSSDDHKPDRYDEKQRIESLGGQVVFWGTWRVQSMLAVSRALGDKYLAPYIIPDPEITQKRLTTDDEFLILGCDGVWDVFNNQEAVDLVKVELNQNGNDYQKAAKALMNAAYAKGSTDNISVIVVNVKPYIKK